MKNSLALYTLLLTTPVLASPGDRQMPIQHMSICVSKNDVLRENSFQEYRTDSFDFALVDFSAMIQSDSVMLKWSVLGNVNHEYFEVERSTNARNWKVIAHVNTAIPGKFNEDYYEADEDPVRGQAFYRLKQVNPDGSSKYSKTIAVYYAGQYRSRTTLPVSSTGSVFIKKRILSKRGMELYNETGHRMIFKTSIVGDDTKLDLGNISNGIYTLRINKGVVAPSIIKLIKN